MSELADLVNSPDNTAVPGHVLTRLDLGDFGELESALEGRAVGLAAAAACRVPSELGERIVARTLDDCMAGLYSYGGVYFDAWAKAAAAAPVLAYLSLKHTHKDITLEQAGDLLKKHPHAHAAVLKMAGYAPRPPKKTESPPPNPPASESAGGTSSKPSDAPATENPDSVTTKSAA